MKSEKPRTEPDPARRTSLALVYPSPHEAVHNLITWSQRLDRHQTPAHWLACVYGTCAHPKPEFEEIRAMLWELSGTSLELFDCAAMMLYALPQGVISPVERAACVATHEAFGGTKVTLDCQSPLYEKAKALFQADRRRPGGRREGK